MLRPTFRALREPPLLERGAYYYNAYTTITTTFFNLSIKTTTIATTTRFFESPNMEARIQEALEYLSSNPTAKVATVTKEFGIPRFRL